MALLKRCDVCDSTFEIDARAQITVKILNLFRDNEYAAHADINAFAEVTKHQNMANRREWSINDVCPECVALWLDLWTMIRRLSNELPYERPGAEKLAEEAESFVKQRRLRNIKVREFEPIRQNPSPLDNRED